MNKWQLICPLTVLLLGISILAVVQGRKNYHAFVLSHGMMIGNELIATTNSSHAAHVGERLKKRLAEFLASPAKVKEVTLGDSPVGDGTATACITLENQKSARLGIRLKQSDKMDKFDVLGFWTIAEGEKQ